MPRTKLAPRQGGTGLDASSLTGLLQFNNGTPSVGYDIGTNTITAINGGLEASFISAYYSPTFGGGGIGAYSADGLRVLFNADIGENAIGIGDTNGSTDVYFFGNLDFQDNINLGTNSIAMTGSIGATGARVTKGWFTDIECTNAIAASITGSAPTLTTGRDIYGNNFNGSAALNQIIASTYGGTGNGFTKFSGPSGTEKTFTLPNADSTLATVAGTETFTNKKFNASSCNFSDNSDATKLLGVSVASNGTGRKATLSFAATSTDKTYSFPNTTGTVLLTTTIGSIANTFSVDQNFTNGGIILDTSAGAGSGLYIGNTGFFIVDFGLNTGGTAVELDFTGANRYCSIELTNASLVSIRSIKSDDTYHVITNKTGNSITLTNNGTPTTGSTVLTGYGSDIVIPNNGTVTLNRDSYSSAFRIFGGVYTIPNVIYSGGALGTPSSGVATNLTGTASSLTSGITNALKSATTTVDVSAATAPSTGQALIATNSTHATWQTIAGPTAATQSDQETATSTTTFVSPARQQYHPSAAKGWADFNGTGTLAINTSYNVSSVTDNGVGDYWVNWSTAFSSANYCVQCTSNPVDNGSTIAIAMLQFYSSSTNPKSAGTVKMMVSGTGGGGSKADAAFVNVTAFGDQ